MSDIKAMTMLRIIRRVMRVLKQKIIQKTNISLPLVPSPNYEAIIKSPNASLYESIKHYPKPAMPS